MSSLALVKYKNDMNNLDVTKLSSTELKLFMAICAGLKDQGTNSITFDFSELRILTGITDKYGDDFVNALENIGKLLMSIIYTEYKVFDKNGKYNISLKSFFTDFDIVPEDESLTVAMHPDLAYMLNDWSGSQWSQFALEYFNSIKGVAAKQLFRILVQYSGYSQKDMYISLNEAMSIMGCTGQRKNNFLNRTLPNAMKQFEKLGIIHPNWTIKKKDLTNGTVLIFHYIIPKEIKMLKDPT